MTVKFRDLLSVMDDFSTFALVVDSQELYITTQCALTVFKDSILDRYVVRIDRGKIYLDGENGNA